MKKFIIILVITLTVLFGCKKLSVPTETLGPANTPTLTPLSVVEITQTAIALQTAGLSAQQTATAAVATMTAQATQTMVALDTPLLVFGEFGMGTGELVLPVDIAVDGSGGIYVADSNQNKIVKYNSSGVFQFEWGTSGTGNGQFSGVGQITVDNANNLYATDYYTDVTAVCRVQKFSSSGAYITSWGGPDYSGSYNGNFNEMMDIVFYGGKIYVLDKFYGYDYTYRLQRFDLSGNFESRNDYASGGYSYYYYNCLIPAISGNWYLIQDYSNTSMWEFSPSFTSLGTWSNPGTDPGEYYTISTGASDSAGNIYLWDPYGGKIIKYSPALVYIKEWHVFQQMSLEGLLTQGGTRMTVDAAGNVYLLFSTYLTRIYKFAP